MAKNFPAPLKCVDCVAAAASMRFEDGLKVERDNFLALMQTTESRALRHFFFGERAASKIPDVPEDTPKRLETINPSILRAQAILNELRANLNHEAGGEIATNLDRLYDYYLRRLFEANLRKQEAPLIEVEGLVRTLRDGWAEMLRSNEVKVA